MRKIFQKHHHGSSSFFFENIVNLNEIAQDLSFYMCNIQKHGESDEFKLTELIYCSDDRDFRKIFLKPSRQRLGRLISSKAAADPLSAQRIISNQKKNYNNEHKN